MHWFYKTTRCKVAVGLPWSSRWVTADRSPVRYAWRWKWRFVWCFPVALLAIILGVRANLSPLRRFRERLSARNARDMTLVTKGKLMWYFAWLLEIGRAHV